MPERDIRHIPLSQLELSPGNVRKTPADAASFTELKASIAAHGLLENLIACAMEPGTDGTGRYAVIAGGRRLAAMQALAAEGAMDGDYPVPCRMVDDTAAETEISLAENTVRAAMHPADQVEAFRRLADAGSNVGDIAKRFGVSERTVGKRLRLGNAAPVLLEAYRSGEIDLETLMAFAVTADQARQVAVWEQVKDQGYRPGAWQIRRMLTEDRVPGTSTIARFVGVGAYEAAGGSIDRDLFAEDDEQGVWFDDPELLNTLATDKLQAAADELATRWKWAEARIDVDWTDIARFGRVRPQPGEPTDEEKAEIERLQSRNDELANMDDDDWTDDLMDEGEAIETRLDQIEAMIEARAVYRREDLCVAGCIVTVGNDGEIRLIQGLVKPEDIPARQPGDAGAAGDGDTCIDTGNGENAGSGIEAPAISGGAGGAGDAEAEARKEAGVGVGLADDLRAIRTAIVKSHLAGDFEAAFDLLLFQLARSIFTPGYHDDALDIRAAETPDRPALRVNDDAFGAINVGEKHFETGRSGHNLAWAGLPDAETFSALRALPERDKRALFASCVARTLKGQLAFEPKARPEVEATVARLDIDFAAVVRGNSDQVWTADLLWSRLRKDRILAIARDTLGEAWAQAHGKDKKAALAAAMHNAFAHGDGVPAGVTVKGREAAVAWTPPGFRAFDLGAADTGTSDDGTAIDNNKETSAPTAQPAAETPLSDAPEDGDDDVDKGIKPSDAERQTPQDGAPEAAVPPDNNTGPAAAEAPRPINAPVHAAVGSLNTPAVTEHGATIASRVDGEDTPPAGANDTPEPADPSAGVAGPADRDAARIAIAAGDRDVSVEPEQDLTPPRGNGQDTDAALPEIPAFLRRG